MKLGKLMSQKEVKKAQILDMLKADKINQLEASQRLGITTRQVRRLAKRYLTSGLNGLISKKRGRASNRQLDEAIQAKVVDLIGIHYRDFGPTLANEKLAELHDIKLSIEATRQLMIKAGYWRPKKGAAICVHPMRERRAHFGELIQIDGSPHDWFEGRGDYCTLLVFIDDATGQLTQLRFAPTETTLGYMHVLHDHILLHGVPAALYSDKHSIFRINAKDADPEAETQFSRAARDLGIECIHAHSPQAKGRVERANQTLQDRLIKEMRLAGINDMDSANAWIPGYIRDFNERFAVEPKESTDAHLAYSGTRVELSRTLSVQIAKTLSKNLSCQHENQLLQVSTTGKGLGLRSAQVTVHEHFNGTIELLWGKRKLTHSVMDKPQRQSPVADGKSVNKQVDKAMAKRGTAHKPAANHPWRKMPVGKAGKEEVRATP
jgi:transposase